MDLCPDSDEQQIINSAAEYLADRLPAARMPAHGPSSISPEEWQGLADMGWFGLGLSAEMGGLDLSVIEEALVTREFGRQLLPPSAAATVLAGHLAGAAGDGRLAERLISGRTRAGFAAPTEPGAGARFLLIDGEEAEFFVIVRPTEGLLVERSAFRDLRTEDSLDASLPLSSATLTGPAISAPHSATDLLQRARVLVASLLVGGAEACRDLAVEYAKTRRQFDAPIGSFQAISHRCAGMAVDCEAAMALTQYAAVTVRDRSPEAELCSASAMLIAGDSALKTATGAIQIFGGYGQTYEYLPHFYLKRAHIYRLLCGGMESASAAVLSAPGYS